MKIKTIVVGAINSFFRIRWRFVVHGGIDGYSRVLTFLNLSQDNKANTVLQHFKRGVVEWGLPVAVR